MIQGHSAKVGGIYLYANEFGSDGGRLFFDGSSCISMNGKFYGMCPQFSINEVEVTSATLDLTEIEAFRSSAFRLAPGLVSTEIRRFERIDLDVNLCDNSKSEAKKLHELTNQIDIKFH